MEAKCKECGKPFPDRQDWCNWCESGPPIPETERPNLYSTASLDDRAKASEIAIADRAATIWLLKWMAILFGLVLVAGGGLVALCSGGGRSGDAIGLLIAIVILSFGGWLIYFGLTPKASKKSVNQPVKKESDIPDSPA